jgi:Icc-related predicted phosphoesterase
MKSKSHSYPRRVAARKRPRPIKPVDLGAHFGPLRLVAFSDYRVQDIELLIEELSKLQPRADLILYAGDDIERFRPPGGRNLFEAIGAQARYGMCAVVGNDEAPSARKLVSGEAVLNVHLLPAKLGSYAILGLEGAPNRPGIGIGFILHSEQEIAKHLSLQRRAVGAAQLIIVSHAPPEGILDHAVRFSPDKQPRSIGSRALRKFVKDRKEVVLVVCGHVHRCGGMHQKVHGTSVVNAANHDDGKAITRFAILELESAGLKTIEWRQIRPVCIVPGIGDVSAQRLRGIGIRTVEELAVAPAEIVSRTALFGRLPDVLMARARAIVENRPIFLRAPELPGEDEVFLDIETDLNQKYIWLIGLCVGEKGKYHGFFADSPKEEKAILIDFLSFMESHPEAELLTCSGSRFEERVIRGRLTFHGLSTTVCDRTIDLFQNISQTVALPTTSCQVKEIGSFFGYRYKHPDLDGYRVASLYMNTYQKSKDRLQRRRLGSKLIEYNEDDVRCLPFILDALQNFWKKEESSGGTSTL